MNERQLQVHGDEHAKLSNGDEVWESVDETFGRFVSVRSYSSVTGPRPPLEQLKKLSAERIVSFAHVRHQFLLRTHEVGTGGKDALFIVRDFCRGDYLSELRIAGIPLDPGILCHALEGVAAAVDHLHASGFVHGAISPYSIVFDKDYAEAYLEVGITNPAAFALLTKNISCHVGHFEYLGRNQLLREKITAADDRTALLGPLFELVSGTHPFGGYSNLDFRRFVSLSLIPYEEMKERISAPVYQFFIRAFSENSEQLFPCLTDIVQELAVHLGVVERVEPPQPTFIDFDNDGAMLDSYDELPVQAKTSGDSFKKVRTLQLSDEESVELRRRLIDMSRQREQVERHPIAESAPRTVVTKRAQTLLKRPPKPLGHSPFPSSPVVRERLDEQNSIYSNGTSRSESSGFRGDGMRLRAGNDSAHPSFSSAVRSLPRQDGSVAGKDSPRVSWRLVFVAMAILVFALMLAFRRASLPTVVRKPAPVRQGAATDIWLNDGSKSAR